MTGLKSTRVVMDVRKGEEMNNDVVFFTVKCTMRRSWAIAFMSMLMVMALFVQSSILLMLMSRMNSKTLTFTNQNDLSR